MDWSWKLLGSVNGSDRVWTCLDVLTLPFLLCLVIGLTAAFLEAQ